MKNNESSLIYSNRNKLISAVAMLLVATIMVVTSTYAWFTLSTAPEVSGISTAVGANGALEMLLATKDANGQWVYGNGSVDGKSEIERNTFWGNLVNLSDSSYYGSGAITLYPSKLNLNNGRLNLLAPLQTPEFGPDGRVQNLAVGGFFATYNGRNFMPSSDYGFRGLGVASGLTERQLAFRTAISALATAQYNAQNEARRSLSENGTSLANIAIMKAMNGENDRVFTQANVDAIGSMISALELSLKQAEEAYIQAITAYALGNQLGHNDDTARVVAGAIKNAATIENAALNQRLTAVFARLTTEGVDATADQNAMLGYDTYTQAVEAVNTAKAELAQITPASDYSWVEIRDALVPLVNVSAIKINGIPAGEVTQPENKSQITSDIASGRGVKVSIPTGGGVYADVADLAGDYTVDIVIQSDSLNVGLDGVSIKASMTADSTAAVPFFAQVSNVINSAGNQPQGDNSGALPLTELYGYVVDLAFRTNAAQSNLLLQTDAVDRIYSENNNAQTMGKGSTMTFKSSSSDFTSQQVKSLMSNIRVVFYNTEDTNSAEIYATAKLDVVNGVVEDANGITAKLYIFKSATATKVEFDNNGVKSILYKVGDKYYNSTSCSEATLVSNVDEAATTVLADNVVVEVRDNVITALNQGDIKHVSVLVYLDGENLENDDVAATVAQSMTGTANFQFASSAELVPMEYADLHTPAGN